MTRVPMCLFAGIAANRDRAALGANRNQQCTAHVPRTPYSPLSSQSEGSAAFEMRLTSPHRRDPFHAFNGCAART